MQVRHLHVEYDTWKLDKFISLDAPIDVTLSLSPPICPAWRRVPLLLRSDTGLSESFDDKASGFLHHLVAGDTFVDIDEKNLVRKISWLTAL